MTALWSNRRVDSTAKKITPRRGRYVSNTADRPELLARPQLLQVAGLRTRLS